MSVNDRNNNLNGGCITIGRMAPNFTAISTDGVITLSQFSGKWVVLISEPAVFAAVPTTSIIELAKMYPEFVKRNCQALCVTLDNNFANIEWMMDIYAKNGIMIPFPLLEDRDKEIADKYGMVSPDRIYEHSVRDLFIISPSGRISAIITYPMSCGRNYYEVLRVLDSLILTEEFGVYTPANWIPGEPLIVPTPHTFKEAVERSKRGESMGLDCWSWYGCYMDHDSLANFGDTY